MTHVGAVDIGTNSVRLLVADIEAEAGQPQLATVDRRMQITRLGEGVDRSRRLAPAALERTFEVLGEYGTVIRDLGVERARATATSAARDADNRDELFGPAADTLGLVPELLSGAEEADLSYRGATAGLVSAPRPRLVIDIGGGSTELILGPAGPAGPSSAESSAAGSPDGDTPEGLVSIDVGCVRITEQFLASDPPSPEELSNAVSMVRDHLADAEREVPGLRNARTAIGLAGTITTVAAVEQGVPYSRDAVHHFRLTRAAAEEVFRTLALEPVTERRHNPGLEPGRVDTIVGGCVVLVAVMRTLGLDELLVSEDDILDGLARSLV